MSNHFFTSLVLGLAMLFGGATSIPKVTSGWTIIDAWTPVASSYVFEARSETILEQCRQQPGGYLVFPAVFESAHRIMVDGQVVARFGDPTFKTVETYYGAPQIKCSDLPPAGRQLVWQVFSSTKYFAHFSSMPRVSRSPTFLNFFNETLAIIAAGALLVLSIFCIAVFYKKIPLRLVLSLVFSCVLLSVYFITTNSRYFNVKMNLLATLKTSDTSLWIGICLFVYCLRLVGLCGRRVFIAYAGLIGISVLIILTASTGDAEQTGTSLPFIFSMVIIAIGFYKVTVQLIRRQGSSRLNGLQALSFGIFSIASINDSMVVMGVYENYMLLPIGIVAGLMFFALAVNEQITAAYAERDHLRRNLEQEVENKTQELTLARDQALAATKAKDTFLANMSHEIRTPLTGIIGFAEYSLDRSLPEKDRLSALATIVSSGKHLLAVINDILDFSKIQADAIETELLDIDPFMLVSEVQSLIMPIVAKKDLFVEVSYELPLPARIVSDPVRLKQILLNLCSNAIKFTEKGGITVTLAYDKESNLMCFCIKDTGIGMTAEQLTKVFDAFKQADSSITRRYGGTGIGLPLSRRLAKLLGGSLQVSSTPGVGSEFELKIDAGDTQDVPWVHEPEQIASQPASVSAASPTEAKLQGKVLLAEDNEVNQQLLLTYLVKMGVEVTLAENGQKALAYASSQDYDLIFMDMQMPVMSGIDAVKQLRQHGYTKPIVALTANATHQDRNQCLEAGCNDFVTKPIMREQFYRVVAHYLQSATEETVPIEPLVSSLLEESPEFVDIVNQFIGKLPEMVDIITSAARGHDWDLFSSEIHKLKGMGGALGFPQFTVLSADMEKVLSQGNYSALETKLAELENLANRVTTEQQKYKTG